MSEAVALAAEPVAIEGAETPLALRACVVVLGGALFAVDVQSAREVSVFETVTIVPRAPAWLLGVANLRGVPMPIVDIRPLLGLPARRARAGLSALVVEDGRGRAAIAIEVALGLESFADAGDSGGHGLIHAVLRRGGDEVTLLDVPGILAALRLDMRGAG